MLPPDVSPSTMSALGSNGPLSPSSEAFQTRLLQSPLLHAVRPTLDRLPSIQRTMNLPEEKLTIILQEPPPELAQPLEPASRASSGAPSISQSIQSRRSIKMFSLFKNMNKQSSGSISESQTSEQLVDAPKIASSSPVSKTLTWFTNKEDQRSTATGMGWFGKAPWHRKDSNDTISSATSSVRDVLAGRTPPVTPDPEGFLSRQQDFTLTPYPAGEATRVRTPPTHEDTADGKPRCFFTDMVPPGEDSDTWDAARPARSTSAKRNQKRCDDSLPKRPKEWWEAKQRTQPKRRLTGPRNFEFDLPEHLPSSPMCPANPKHSSGGVGVCVYHGRGRKEYTLKLEHKMSDRRQGSEVSITSETDERSTWD
ncbi:hypothetical protein BDP55DRAFT_209391 [Colletotrichum godetiae]|uniref:Uncharacterized protein n=1 Tax=Colletotrichum godetiae TaxID=1209918 RepID=A0AAJ0AZK0_9PEZI|nr:uncharacterized protein BDP55DRAFT_209391 [Colletotrichum godetiae]KAK1699859.1 hypothetical protein BDP55DRAFT_209391 [Colletotrichum godetiae]